jgi:hypothetical protein
MPLGAAVRAEARKTYALTSAAAGLLKHNLVNEILNGFANRSSPCLP